MVRDAVYLLALAGVERFVLTSDHGFLLQDTVTTGNLDFGANKLQAKRRHSFGTEPSGRSDALDIKLSALEYTVSEERYLSRSATAAPNPRRPPTPPKSPRRPPHPGPPPGEPSWADLVADDKYRKVLAILESGTMVNEAELREYLGSARQVRLFALRYEQVTEHLPFEIEIRTVAGLKTYVRKD